MHLRLHQSRIAAVALTSMHVLAVVSVFSSQFSAPALMSLLALLAFSLWHTLRSHAWKAAPNAVVALTWRASSGLELEQADGRRTITQIEASSVVLHWLMVLHLGAGQRRLTLLLLPDMIDRASWRRLAVELRLRKNYS